MPNSSQTLIELDNNSLPLRQSFIEESKFLMINLISFIIIGTLSGAIQSILVIFAYSFLTFFYIRFFEKITNDKKRKWYFSTFLLLHIVSFVGLQKQGAIGILNLENATSPNTIPLFIGFSFYMLQSIAICGAVYRYQMRPLSFQRYLLAISFFGAFVAGPLFNLQQLKKFHNLELGMPNVDRLYSTLHLVTGGLLFKFVLANWLSQWIDIQEMSDPMRVARSVLCFELQVYFDFAAYSLFSLAICRLFQIPMYYNFSHPFSAKDIPSFWRLWHIGLGTWFKENVYLPLRERFQRPWERRAAIPLLVFLLSAAWHGPTMIFLLWGLFHGLAFVGAVYGLKFISDVPIGRWLSRIYVLVVLFYGRLLFMDSDTTRLVEKFKTLGRFKKLSNQLMDSLSFLFANFFSVITKNWENFLIGSIILSLLIYEIFVPIDREKNPYQYFIPGIATIVIFIFVLFFIQPTQRAGFVYGR